MIQTATAYRARPKCTHCGWVGDWRSSTQSQRLATQAAVTQLRLHVDFWHPDDATEAVS